jgi:hypothetical protein
MSPTASGVGGVEVGPVVQQDDVRLRLRVRKDRQRILGPECRATAQACEQQISHPRDTRGVPNAYRRQVNDHLDVRRHAVIQGPSGAPSSMPIV